MRGWVWFSISMSGASLILAFAAISGIERRLDRLERKTRDLEQR